MSEWQPAIIWACQETDNNITCMRYCFSLLISIIVTMLSIFMLIRYYKNNGRLCYEMAPMSSSACQGLLHVIQYSLYNNNQVTLITNYIQIVTFAFIGQSFCYLYYHMTINVDEFRQKYKMYLMAPMIIYFVLFMAQLIAILQVETYDCSQDYYFSEVLILVQITMTTLITVIYGNRLKNLLNKYEVDHIPKKQITIVQLSLSGSTLIFVTMSLVITVSYNDYLCNYNHTDFDLEINSLLELITLTQILPCFLIPFIFYKEKIRRRSQNSIVFMENPGKSFFIPKDEDDFVQRYTIENKY